MIDPRFPPQPRRKIVYLYPNRDKNRLHMAMNIIGARNPQKKFEDNLDIFLPDHNGRFYFRDSAGSCLSDYLSYKAEVFNRPVKVAMPAFCCPNLCLKIVESGAMPIFLDIDNQYGISKKGIKFAIKHGADFLLWPSFFGSRRRNEEILNYAKFNGLEVILDEAQSFPQTVLSNKFLSLLSFGKNKRLQGIGGGALYFSSEIQKDISIFSFNEKYNAHYKGNLIIEFNFLTQYVEYFFSVKNKSSSLPQEESLPILLEKITNNFKSHKTDKMKAIEFLIANSNLINLNRTLDNNNILFSGLKEFIINQLGEEALHPLTGLEGPPSIFAIRVPNGQRYSYSCKLAEIGIQTTWYYYPLNMLGAFSHYPAEELEFTMRLSSEILILPFGLGNILNDPYIYLNALNRL